MSGDRMLHRRTAWPAASVPQGSANSFPQACKSPRRIGSRYLRVPLLALTALLTWRLAGTAVAAEPRSASKSGDATFTYYGSIAGNNVLGAYSKGPEIMVCYIDQTTKRPTFWLPFKDRKAAGSKDCVTPAGWQNAGEIPTFEGGQRPAFMLGGVLSVKSGDNCATNFQAPLVFAAADGRVTKFFLVVKMDQTKTITRAYCDFMEGHARDFDVREDLESVSPLVFNLSPHFALLEVSDFPTRSYFVGISKIPSVTTNIVGKVF